MDRPAALPLGTFRTLENGQPKHVIVTLTTEKTKREENTCSWVTASYSCPSCL